MSSEQQGEKPVPPTQSDYEKLRSRLDSCQQVSARKDATISELQEALQKVTPFKDAKALSEGDQQELKILREAYKVFTYTIDTDRYNIEIMVEPVSKTVDVLAFRLKR